MQLVSPQPAGRPTCPSTHLSIAPLALIPPGDAAHEAGLAQEPQETHKADDGQKPRGEQEELEEPGLAGRGARLWRVVSYMDGWIWFFVVSRRTVEKNIDLRQCQRYRSYQ